MVSVFWASVGLVLYAYFGYPLALAAISIIRRRQLHRAPITPRVSFIITAHNEAAAIRRKIENTLDQEYPADRLEIIVASDSSTDGTDSIVASFGGRLRLVRSPQRRGKEAAQQLAVAAASGDILIFSDVATTLARDGVSTMVENFADPTVGCVSSIDRFVDADGRVSGEGAYVRYEMWLRGLETRTNSLVGLSGSFFGARREVCQRWAPDRQSDFNTLLNAIDMGLRGVLDVRTAGYYTNIADERREFHRKVRTVVRSLHVLGANRRLLNPWRYGFFAWQLASHKLCRWLVPFAMIAAVVTNAALTRRSPTYLTLFLGQSAFYAAAIGGLWIRSSFLRIPAYLCVANLGVLTAWLRFVRGERMTTWTPSARTVSPANTSQ
jgi:glycosyltransferase involved in cell wall biosynthesis